MLGGLFGRQCRHVQVRLAESVGVGRVGGPAAAVVGLGATDIDQVADQLSVALGLLPFDRHIARQFFHLFTQPRLDTGIQQVARLLGGGDCPLPGTEVTGSAPCASPRRRIAP